MPSTVPSFLAAISTSQMRSRPWWDGEVGCVEGAMDVAAGDVRVVGGVAPKLLVEVGSALLDRFLDVDHRRQGLILDLDPLAGVLGRGPARSQDDRERLAHVMD